MSNPARTSERVPEISLAVGVVLAVPVGLFVALVEGDPLAAAALALALFYPFAAYAVRFSDDPASVLVPDAVLATGVGLGALGALAGLVVARPATGLAVGLFAAVPTVAYHVRYGASVNPLSPRATVALGGLLAAVALAVGLATGDDLAGAAGAVLALFAAADYRSRRGGRFDRRTERFVVGGCFGGATLLVVVAVLVDRALVGVVVALGLIAVGTVIAQGVARNETLS
ncbi:hypothetical protein ACFQPA_10095 [Halomarina halobia]|uniref:Phosphatidate cytidylyltransferase n=1 Tax=Halomarina halobia TaxID=3033386 RepID=A0ABD6AB41_9EURY|nr:hypothetical protein [Halomarina sp. PSR21]